MSSNKSSSRDENIENATDAYTRITCIVRT